MARRPQGVQQPPAQPARRDPLVQDMFDPDPRPLGEIVADVERRLRRRLRDRARRAEQKAAREAALAAAPRPWDERQGELDLDQPAPAPDPVDEFLAAFREIRAREEVRQRRREALRVAAAARKARRRA